VDNELEVIQDDMEQTRAKLATKLEALESQVRETVSGASETVEGVKGVVDTVSETVGSVKETLNVSKHVEKHPWAAMGIAVATGFVAAQLLGGSSSAPAPPPRQEPVEPPAPPPQPVAQTPPQPAEESHGMLHSLESMLPDMNVVLGTAMTGIGSLAVGTLMGVIREVAVNSLPAEWKDELSRVVDQVTTQLGGKPLKAIKREDSEQVTSKPTDDNLSRLEELPSHEENVTQPETSDEESNPRSRRGGRNQVKSMT